MTRDKTCVCGHPVSSHGENGCFAWVHIHDFSGPDFMDCMCDRSQRRALRPGNRVALRKNGRGDWRRIMQSFDRARSNGTSKVWKALALETLKWRRNRWCGVTTKHGGRREEAFLRQLAAAPLEEETR